MKNKKNVGGNLKLVRQCEGRRQRLLKGGAAFRAQRGKGATMMSQVLNLTVAHPNSPFTRPELSQSSTARARAPLCDWSSLQQRLKSNGRFSCLFSDSRREVT